MDYVPSYSDSLYADIQPSYSDSLMHHGIKGMHWGVRRYQNTDGSYTAAGKKHRNASVGDSTTTKKSKRKGMSKETRERLIGAAAGAAAIGALTYGGYKAVKNRELKNHENPGAHTLGGKVSKTPKRLTDESESTRKAYDYREKVERNKDRREDSRRRADNAMRDYAARTSVKAKGLPGKRGVGYNDVESSRQEFERRKNKAQEAQREREWYPTTGNTNFNAANRRYKNKLDDMDFGRGNYRGVKREYEGRMRESNARVNNMLNNGKSSRSSRRKKR